MNGRQSQGRSATASVGALVIIASVLLSAAHAEATEKTMVSVLNGYQEVPPVVTEGSGCARYEIDTINNRLRYYISYCGLTGPATAAHFHGPAPIGANAGVKFGLTPGNPIVGAWSYPEADEADILAGRMYVNIHTAAHPGGEIRGQVVDMVAIIDGAQESPPSGSGGYGYGLFLVDEAANTLSYHITEVALDGVETAAHIHGFALHGVNAGVIHPLPAGSPKIGVYAYNPADEGRILNGETYVNIHSNINPGGEIRGQITQMVAPLDGAQESPPTTSVPCGSGLLAIGKAETVLSYYLTYKSLTGAATAAHIHGFAPPGANAGVLHGVGTANPAIGAWDFPAGDLQSILDGLTYFNVHTAVHPGGEIRGQLIIPNKPCPTDIDCSGDTGFSDLLEVLSNWGPYGPCPPYKPADIDQNCEIGFSDLLEVLSRWGACP